MAQRSQPMVASMFIFLVLSVHPLEAMRSMQSQGAFSSIGESQELMSELRKALDEDSQGSDDAWLGEIFATCPQRKADFERRIVKVKARYDHAMEDGTMDAFEAAWVILKARVLAKTLKVAEKQECEWVSDKSVDKTVLTELVQQTAGKSKCWSAVQATLEAASELPDEEQGAAMKDAIGVYMSDTCEVPDRVDTPTDGVAQAEADVEHEMDLDATQLEKSLKAQGSNFMELESLTGQSLLKAEGINTSQIFELLKEGTPKHSTKAMLIEMVENVRSGVGAAGQVRMWLAVIGFICLLIFWAIFCWVIMSIVMLILGLIMCFIKLIIVAFLRLIGSQFWDFDYGGCMGFWLGALGHSGSRDDSVITLCAPLGKNGLIEDAFDRLGEQIPEGKYRSPDS